MTGITSFALGNSRFVILFQVAIVLFGIFAFLNYPKREDPSIVIREAVVTAHFPGMSTRRVEDLITRKIEEKIREIPEVKEIRSDSKTGVSIVHVIGRDEVKDIETVWQDLRNKMDDVRPLLPSGTIGPLVNDEFGLTSLATIALWADGFSLAEMRDVARDARDRLYALKGIEKVELFGIQEERIYLEVSNTKIAQLGISPRVIISTLQSQNIILPGGKYVISGREIIVEPSGNFNDVAEIQSVILNIPGSDRVIPLRDIAKIKRDYVDPPRPGLFQWPAGHRHQRVGARRHQCRRVRSAPDCARKGDRGRPAVRVFPGVRHLSAGAHRNRRARCGFQCLPVPGDRFGGGDSVLGISHRPHCGLFRAPGHAHGPGDYVDRGC